MPLRCLGGGGGGEAAFDDKYLSRMNKFNKRIRWSLTTISDLIYCRDILCQILDMFYMILFHSKDIEGACMIMAIILYFQMYALSVLGTLS